MISRMAALSLLTLSCGVHATETTTFQYDAQGRLIKASKAGGPVGGQQACTDYDPSGNRTASTVSASGCNSGSSGGGGSSASFAINSPSAKLEGSSIVFTVTKTGSGAASVNYATANVDAIAGSDYAAKNGTLSFASGEATKTISIATFSDSLVEATETFRVVLSNPTAGATIASALGTGLILNNSSTGCNPTCD